MNKSDEDISNKIISMLENVDINVSINMLLNILSSLTTIAINSKRSDINIIKKISEEFIKITNQKTEYMMNNEKEF